MCSYLARFPKKSATAVVLGAAVIFVLAVTVPFKNWLLESIYFREMVLGLVGRNTPLQQP